MHSQFIVLLLCFLFSNCAISDKSFNEPIIIFEIAQNKIFYNDEIKELKCDSDIDKIYTSISKPNMKFDLFCINDSTKKFYIPFQFTDVEGKGLFLYQKSKQLKNSKDRSSILFQIKNETYLIVRKNNYSKNFIGQDICIKNNKFYQWNRIRNEFETLNLQVKIPKSKLILINDDCIEN